MRPQSWTPYLSTMKNIEYKENINCYKLINRAGFSEPVTVLFVLFYLCKYILLENTKCSNKVSMFVCFGILLQLLLLHLEFDPSP